MRIRYETLTQHPDTVKVIKQWCLSNGSGFSPFMYNRGVFSNIGEQIPPRPNPEELDAYFWLSSLEVMKQNEGYLSNHKNWFYGDSFNCRDFYVKFDGFMFNKRWALMPLAQCKRDLIKLERYFGAPVWIRPDSGMKVFDATKLEEHSLGEISPNTLCLVAPYQEVSDEVRFVVSRRELLACSMYRINGLVDISPVVPQSAIDFAQQLLSVKMPDICVLDLARTKNGEWGVMELNSIHTSCWYDCEVRKILDRVKLLLTKA
jgi:hypothetical protein